MIWLCNLNLTSLLAFLILDLVCRQLVYGQGSNLFCSPSTGIQMRRYFFFASSSACRICSASSGRSPPLLYTTQSAWPCGLHCPASAPAVVALAALASLPCQCLFQFLVRKLDMDSEVFLFLLAPRNCQGQIKKEQWECRSECVGPLGLWLGKADGPPSDHACLPACTECLPYFPEAAFHRLLQSLKLSQPHFDINFSSLCWSGHFSE